MSEREREVVSEVIPVRADDEWRTSYLTSPHSEEGDKRGEKSDLCQIKLRINNQEEEN